MSEQKRGELTQRIKDLSKRLLGYEITQTELRLMSYMQYTMEHRLILEQKLGRKLKRSEHGHHINGNKQDNRPENLEVFSSNGKHVAFHHKLCALQGKPSPYNTPKAIKERTISRKNNANFRLLQRKVLL